MMRVISTATGKEILPGERVETFRGESYILRNFRPPHKPGSTGRVGLDNLDGSFYGEFFPGVINARIEAAPATGRISTSELECMECHHKLTIEEAELVIEDGDGCPGCGGSDIDIAL